MSRTILILPDQVARNNSALAEILKPASESLPAQVLMVECPDLLDQQNLTKSDLTLRLSALRHFAQELRRRKLTVDYHSIRESGTPESCLDALRTHIAAYGPEELLVMEPTSPLRARNIQRISMRASTPLRVTANSLFISDRRQTEALPTDVDQHYQSLRAKLDILMEDGKPLGGVCMPAGGSNSGRAPLRQPEEPKFAPDEITTEVIRTVIHVYPDLKGSVEGFSRPVTHAEANDLVDFYIQYGLLDVPTYAMLAPLLQIGLLAPLHLVKKAETGFKTGKLCLSAAEGFIREVLGTREYLYLSGWFPKAGETDGTAD